MTETKLIDFYAKRLVNSDEVRTNILLTQFTLELKSILQPNGGDRVVSENEKQENNCLDVFHNADIELNGICKMCKGITKR